MPNMNSLFVKFNSNVRLDSEKRRLLNKGKNALKTKIINKFEEKGRSKPKFKGQGSFSMDTILNQLEDKDYDIDYGIYLDSYNDKKKEEWPVTSTIHTWIKDAVDGHTSTPPVDKNTCVRVIYANDYHIDLPAYIIKDDIAYLAHKEKGWIESDPKAFTDWFNKHATESGVQLRRVVRYLKAWKDYQNRNVLNVDLSGICITILAVENFYSSQDRDDKSLLGTVSNIIETLENDFTCTKPVIPYEDLLDEFEQSKKDSIINKLSTFKIALQNSIDLECEYDASLKLIKQFGDRFPEGTKKDPNKNSNFVKSEAPAVINDDGRSA